MKKSIYIIILCLPLILLTLIAGCEKEVSTFNSKNFMDELTKLNINYSVDKNTSKDMLSVAPIIININKDRFFIFEYKNSKAMEKDASTIDSGGCTVGNHKVSWVSYPHFYKKGNLIIQYVGDNKNIISTLEQILGKQFAGYNQWYKKLPSIKLKLPVD